MTACLVTHLRRNRSEKRCKDSLWSTDKDWSPDVDMESSAASED